MNNHLFHIGPGSNDKGGGNRTFIQGKRKGACLVQEEDGRLGRGAERLLQGGERKPGRMGPVWPCLFIFKDFHSLLYIYQNGLHTNWPLHGPWPGSTIHYRDFTLLGRVFCILNATCT
jgi:hypothetical protein